MSWCDFSKSEFRFIVHVFTLEISASMFIFIIHIEDESVNQTVAHCVIAQFFQDAVSESNLDEMEAEVLRNKLYKVTTG